MFATDRDLLVLEPTVFNDVGWVGQRLVKTTGSISGTTLTVAATPDLEQVDVRGGHVALVNDVPYEVIERLSPTELTVSRLRSGSDGAVLPPAEITDAPVEVHTFGPQIALVHGQVLRAVGIEPDEPADPGAPAEEDITNPAALARLEALGALHLVFSAAAALAPVGSSQEARAALYRDRFAAERRRVVARLDLDGDGLPDATRRPNVVQFMRA